MSDGLRIFGPLNTGTTTGGAGVSTANATSSTIVTGLIHAIYVRYNDSPPATTDLTIATAGNNTPANTILTLTNSASSGMYYPRADLRSQTGIALTFDGTRTVTDRIVISDNLKVTIAQANDGDSADVWLYLY